MWAALGPSPMYFGGSLGRLLRRRHGALQRTSGKCGELNSPGQGACIHIAVARTKVPPAQAQASILGGARVRPLLAC